MKPQRREFRAFMSKQMQVVRCLLDNHHLEQDTVGGLLDTHGSMIRESVGLGMPADSIANEVASHISI